MTRILSIIMTAFGIILFSAGSAWAQTETGQSLPVHDVCLEPVPVETPARCPWTLEMGLPVAGCQMPADLVHVDLPVPPAGRVIRPPLGDPMPGRIGWPKLDVPPPRA